MQVAIVKYNAGNIYSVVNALKRLGIAPLLTDDAELLMKADKVLFPGQGHAGEAMDYLRARKLDQVISDLKQPVFGICVGQQLLCRHSEEGNTDCIGIFDAEVKRATRGQSAMHGMERVAQFEITIVQWPQRGRLRILRSLLLCASMSGYHRYGRLYPTLLGIYAP